MTDEEIRQILTAWAKDWCNNAFLVDNPDYDPNDPESPEYVEQVPAGVTLFIDAALQAVKRSAGGVQSETLGDYSVTFDRDSLNALARIWLTPYRRVRFA